MKKICIAQITQPHGVKGLLKIASFTEVPENIFTYDNVTDELDNSYKLNKFGNTKSGFIIKLEQSNSRTDAEALKGTKLYITETSLPSTAKDEFFYHHLKGLKVLSDNKTVGEVIAVHNFGAGDIIEIHFSEINQSEFLPLTKEVFPEINTEKGEISLHKPEYL